MKHKFLTKLVLGALISSTLVGSFTRVSHSQSVENVQPVEQVSNKDVTTISVEDINDIIEKFENIQGDETYGEYTVIKGEGYVGRINKDTGDITHETYDDNGVLVNSYTTNFYENLQNMTNTRDLQNIETRQTIISEDIPYKLSGLYYNISQYGNVQKLYAQNSNNRVTAFDLKGDYRYNQSIKDFVHDVDDTAFYAGRLASYVGGSIAVGLVAAIGLFIPSISLLKKVLATLGFTGGSVLGVNDRYEDFVTANNFADTDYKFLAP